MSELRTKMDNDMVLRGMAVRTREAYLDAVRGLAKFYRRSPDQISEAEVQSYLLHWLPERGLSSSTCNIVANGLRFFYRVSLGRSETEFCLPSARQPSRLPEILSREEIKRLFESTLNLKHRALLMATYSAGLRVSEVAHLRVSDIDSSRMAIRVGEAKGRQGPLHAALQAPALFRFAAIGWPTGRSTGSFPCAMPTHPSIRARPRRFTTMPSAEWGSPSAAASTG